MTIRDAFTAAMPFVVGLGVPIGLGVAGTTLPIVYDQAKDLAFLQAQVASLKDDTTEIKGTQVHVAASLEGIELKVGDLGTKLDDAALRTNEEMHDLENRMVGLEADPAALLKAIGEAPDASSRVFATSNVLYLHASKMDLSLLQKWPLVELSPFVRAFKLPFDEETVQDYVAAAQAETASVEWEAPTPVGAKK